MSIINQMLRELDARGGAANGLPLTPPTQLVSRLHQVPRMAVSGLLLAGVVAGVVAYGWASKGPNVPPQPALPGQLATATVPVSVVPGANDVPAVKTSSEPSRPALAEDKAKPGVSPPFQLARVLPARPLIVTPDAPTPAAPTVIKKPAKLPPELEAQQLFDDAQALRRAGNNDLAAAKYRQALELDPGMRHARLQLAGLLQEGGQGEAALQLLKSGYEQQPNDALAIATGRMLADQGRRDEAISWLERGRAGMRPPDSAMMGALLSQAQRFDEAVKAYQHALAFQPNQGGWSLGLGLALESLGRHDEARSAYRNALEHGKFKPEVLEFLQQKSEFPG